MYQLILGLIILPAMVAQKDFHYNNLSCPFEWSKYSCVHQGKQDTANICIEYAKGQLQGHFYSSPPTGRTLIVGDSQMRQVFIGMACALREYTEHYHVDWQPKWPCHGTQNCVSGGNHSGFDVGSIYLRGGSEIHFLPHSGSLAHNNGHIMNDMLALIKRGRNPEITRDSALKPRAGRTLVKGDTLIYNVGIHLGYAKKENMLNATAEFGRRLIGSGPLRPMFVYVGTPTQHFKTRTGAHNWNASKECQGTVLRNALLDRELKILKEGETVDYFVEYADLELGHLHIGGNDCTHYCMPGVPDVVASKILALPKINV